MKFATRPVRQYPAHLRRVATLPWEIENQFFADVEENANKLHF